MEELIQFLPPEALMAEYIVSALSEVVDWGHTFLNVEIAQKHSEGEDIVVAVLDTGMPNHIDLNDNLLPGLSTIGTDIYDHQGHGTHVAGTIAALQNGFGVIGVAPKCKILAIKVLDDSGSGSYQSITDGINLAVENKVDIISMSLGCPQPSQQLQDAIQRAFNAGVIIVAAAGNSHGAVDYPAAYPEVIAVSAIDKNGHIADFSCRGDAIKAAAPGVDCYSTYTNNQYALLSGTSQATPYISGVCALLLAWARKTPTAEQIHNCQDMLKVLSEVCNSNNVLVKQDYGFGIPDFANYMPWKTVVSTTTVTTTTPTSSSTTTTTVTTTVPPLTSTPVTTNA